MDRVAVFDFTLSVWQAQIQTMDENDRASAAFLILQTPTS
jgi:hypothetical protein